MPNFSRPVPMAEATFCRSPHNFQEFKWHRKICYALCYRVLCCRAKALDWALSGKTALKRPPHCIRYRSAQDTTRRRAYYDEQHHAAALIQQPARPRRRGETDFQRFAQVSGLTVRRSAYRDARYRLTGTVANMQRAFGVSLSHKTVEGVSYRVREGSIHLPTELQGYIVAVLGLDNRLNPNRTPVSLANRV